MADTTQVKARGFDTSPGNADGRLPVDERLAFAQPSAWPVDLHPGAPVGEPTGLSPKTLPVQAPDKRSLRSAISTPAATLRTRTNQALVDETEYGTLFVTIPVFLIVGSAAYFALPVEPARHQVPALLLVVAALAFAVRNYWYPRLCFVALSLGLGGALIAQLHTQWQATPMMGSAVVTTVTGRVVNVERRPGNAARYTVKILKTERPRLPYAPDIVRITSRKENPALIPGAILKATAQLRAASAPVRAGGYDFAFQAYFAGYGANGFSYGTPKMISAEGRAPFGGLSGIRLALADRIVAHAPDRPASAVAAALIAGKKSAIPEEVTEALRRTGLAHILAISGLHMALVAGTMMFFIRLILSSDQSIAARRQTKKWAAIVALGVATIYLMLAGASIATQRSYIMLSVMLLALCFDRPALTKRNLAIAAILIIVLAPDAVITPGFQMSFAATLALIGGYDILNRARSRPSRQEEVVHPVFSAFVGVFRVLLGLAATSIIAGIATGIFSAYHFHRIAPLSLFANVAAMPVVTFVTMPSALIAMAAMPFGLDGFVFPVMFFSIEKVISIADYFATLSSPGLVGAMSVPRMLLLSAALVMICVPRTWIRIICVIPLFLAFIPQYDAPTPLLRVSEDARQVALFLPGFGGRPSQLAFNRNRPNRFTVDQWAHADAVQPEHYVKPTKAAQDAEPNRFHCDGEGLCTARYEIENHEALNIAIIDTPERDATDLCGRYDLIIESFAPTQLTCEAENSRVPTTTIITAQSLALKGAAEIYRVRKSDRNGTETQTLNVKYAIKGDLRPWHAHRIFSRSARNLAPYRPRTGG